MYSIVMMAALTTGADATPAPVVVAAPPVVAGCCGYSAPVAAGCCGYSSYAAGCCGGVYAGGHGCLGGMFGHRHHGHKHSCHGGGGCCGYSSYYAGCCGGFVGYGYGGCCGGVYASGYSYGLHYASCYGSYAHGVSSGCGYLPPYGPYNIGGGSGVYSAPGYYNVAPVMGAPAVVVPAAPVAPAVVVPNGGAKLKLVVPAEAKLYVDGRRVGGEGTERAFYTPALEPGRKFFYEVKAELTVRGETVVEEKRVVVQAGDDLREAFPRLLAAAGRPEAVASK